MLCGNFAEAQAPFLPSHPPTVSLPEDDPETVLLLSKILHHDPSAQDKASYDLICELATLSDKYDCGEALQDWFRGQVSQYLHLSHDFIDLGVNVEYWKDGTQFTVISYLVDDYEVFTPAPWKDDILSKIIKAAYLMDDSEVFTLATRRLVFVCQSNETRHRLQAVFKDLLPNGLIGMEDLSTLFSIRTD